MEPVFTSLFIAPGLFSYVSRWRTELFFAENWVRAFPPDLSALAHACINPRSASRHCEQRTTQRVIFFQLNPIISQLSWSPYLTYFRKLLNLLSPPPTFFFESFRNHQCPFWNHCFNKQQIMRRRLQNKRASQLRPLNSGRKRQEFLWGHDPNDQSLTRFANAASLFSPHSICRGFQIPAAIPNTIDMISNFSNNPLSITSR